MAPSPDVDRGWAFVIIFGYFFMRFLALGMTFSPAILYSRLLLHFEGSPVLTAWAINLNTFTTYMSGEITNFLIKTIGPRRTIAVGSIVACIGLMVTSFATNLTYVFIFYGVMTGIGYSMMYISSVQVVAQYLVKYRRMAVLLASSGLCIGQFVLPHLFRVLTEAYTWRGALMIMAGLNLNFLVVSAAYMPVRPATPDLEEHELQQLHPNDGEPNEPELQPNDAGEGEPELHPNDAEADNPELQRLHPNDAEEHAPARRRRSLPLVIKNLRLCKNPYVVLFFLSCILAGLGVSAITTHIKNCAHLHGITDSETTLLQSLLGATSLIGSIVIGISAMNPKVRIMGFYVSFFICLSICIAFFGLLKSYASFIVMTCFLGFWLGVLSAFPEAVISVVGVANVATGLSYCSMGVAFGIVSGGPLAAFLLQFDPTYVMSFLVSGGLCLLGCFLNFPFLLKDLPCRNCHSSHPED